MLTVLRMPKLSYWLIIPAIAKPLPSVWRMISVAESKCYCITATVNSFLTFRNASSAARVHSHIPGELFSTSEDVVVTLAYLRMNCR